MSARNSDRNKPAKKNTVRVIGGALRNSKIDFPDMPGLRPTADRIRETVFNWLQNDIPGGLCVDLFAGSGALGIEAVSRGASKVILVEANPATSNAISDNLRRLNIETADSVCIEAKQWLQRQSESFVADVVFLDPPFAADAVYETCMELEEAGVLKPGSKIYIESGSNIELEKIPSAWTLLKNKKAGQVMYYLFARGENT